MTMRDGWVWRVLVLGALLATVPARGAEPSPEVRELMKRYERDAEAKKPKKPASRPAPKPASRPRPKPVVEPADVDPPEQALSAPAPREPEMVRIPGGCFQMGSPESEAGRGSIERQHRVCMEAFEIGKYEVTVAEFRRFADATGYRTDAERNVGGNGCFVWSATDNKSDWRAGLSWRTPGYEQSDAHPVTCVSWNDAKRYAEWLWLMKGTERSYRLPTEAEWEYAARAGTGAARYWGDDPSQACRYANVADRTPSPTGTWAGKHDCADGHFYPAPVGAFQPNAWQLHDMLGNVSEWTCSAYDEDYRGPEKVCADDTSDSFAERGGAWDSKPMWVRSAARAGIGPADLRDNRVGFRLARSL